MYTWASFSVYLTKKIKKILNKMIMQSSSLKTTNDVLKTILLERFIQLRIETKRKHFK